MALGAIAFGLSIAGTLAEIHGLQQARSAAREEAASLTDYTRREALQSGIDLEQQAKWEAGESKFAFTGVSLDTGTAQVYEENIYDSLQTNLAQLEENLGDTIADIRAGRDTTLRAVGIREVSTLLRGGSDVAGHAWRFKDSKS